MQTTSPHVDEVRKFLSTRKSLSLFRVVSLRYGSALPDIDDSVQDIAMRCLEQASMFRGGNVEAWATVVATRALLNKVRKPKYPRIVVEYDERVDTREEYAPPPDVVAEVAELGELFGALLTEEELALCADLRRHDGSVADLAREQEANVNSVHTKKGRLARKFARLIES